MPDEKQICGNCNFCEKDDGDPFCWMKDLFTTVELDQDCDEYDIRGKKYWVPVKESKK